MIIYRLARSCLNWLLLFFQIFSALSLGKCAKTFALEIDEEILLDNSRSSFSRSIASMNAQTTFPVDPTVERSNFPNADPHVCLAFLSCCNRTDLLNHTLAGAIRHMEEDEPEFLRYEIAWVDNGSAEEKTKWIMDSYEIDHALRLPSNMGLAYGMNALIFNLCKAPYVLLLEEDWLYLDEIVAPQTPERKRAIATSLALLETMEEQNLTSFDRRKVMGVFLRHETYESFLKFPLMDNWETVQQVAIEQKLSSMYNVNFDAVSNGAVVDIDYQIFCGDVSFQNENIWGSYTNGAGLYRRKDLMQVGRMFGEPGDAFHDRYIESNYAYRVAIGYCHAALRLTTDRSCDSIHDPLCTGAFHHIGGGRGTRPRNAKGTTCDTPAWHFLGTPLYKKFTRYLEKSSGQALEICSKEELEELRQRKFRDQDADQYRKAVKEESDRIFEQQKAERERLKMQADLVEELLQENPVKLREQVQWLALKSDDEIKALAKRLRDLADSPHPLEGYFDSHGRPIMTGG